MRSPVAKHVRWLLLLAALCFARESLANYGKDSGNKKAPAAAKNRGSAESSDAKIYRFKGEKKGNLGGAQAMMLVLEDVFTGKTESLYVPNNDPSAKTYDPLTAVASAVAELEPGMAVEVKTEKQKGRPVIVSLSKPEGMKPGEELPNGFVFVESKDEGKGVPNVVVTLSKFGREIQAAIPNWRDSEKRDAEWQPDPKIDSVVRRLQSGTVVEAQFRRGSRMPTLTEIYQMYPPERGKFVKVKDVTFNEWPAAGFEIVDDAGTTISFTLEGTKQTKNNQTVYVPNMQQYRALKKIKPDTPVEVRYRVDGTTWMMRDIRLLEDGAKTSKPKDSEKMQDEKMQDDKSDKDEKSEKDEKSGTDDTKPATPEK